MDASGECVLDRLLRFGNVDCRLWKRSAECQFVDKITPARLSAISRGERVRHWAQLVFQISRRNRLDPVSRELRAWTGLRLASSTESAAVQMECGWDARFWKARSSGPSNPLAGTVAFYFTIFLFGDLADVNSEGLKGDRAHRNVFWT